MSSRAKRLCACGAPIVITGVGKDGGTRYVDDHDLCRRCWRSKMDSEMAGRLRPRVDRETLKREKRSWEQHLRRQNGG